MHGPSFRLLRMPRLYRSVIFLGGVSLATCGISAAIQRPNVLLIVSDDHSILQLGANGDENCRQLGLPPHVDTFAKA